MRPCVTAFYLCLALFFSPSLLPAGDSVVRNIPNARWVEIYFKAIDRVATSASLPSLRTGSPPADHREVRLWSGFGLAGLDGLILKRDGGVWSAAWISERRDRAGPEIDVARPRSSWEAVWDGMQQRGLLTLPDFSALPDDGIVVHDGVSLVVETWVDGKYRTYLYENPRMHDQPEARLLESLWAFSRHEFGRGSGIVPARQFLTPLEVLGLTETVAHLKYPVATREFLAALKIDFHARDLDSNGTTEYGPPPHTTISKEWRLTSRADPRGYFALVVYLPKSDTSSVGLDQAQVRHAEVIFHDRAFFPGFDRVLTLQPQDYPQDRILPPSPSNASP